MLFVFADTRVGFKLKTTSKCANIKDFRNNVNIVPDYKEQPLLILPSLVLLFQILIQRPYKFSYSVLSCISLLRTLCVYIF